MNNVYYQHEHIIEDSTESLPDFRFMSTPIKTAYTFAVSNETRIDPNFLPDVVSKRVCFQQLRDSDILPIVFDTGCSYAMTYDINDFESRPLTGTFGHVTTASGTLDITGFGIARWKVQASDGSLDEIRIPCHLIPQSTQRSGLRAFSLDDSH